MTELTSLDPDSFVARLDEAVSVWREAFGEAAYRDVEAEIERRADMMSAHARRSGFRAIFAVDGEDVVGIGYGCSGSPGTFWHDAVRSLVDRATAHQWLDDGFEVCELHVRPGRQGRGVGRRLLRRLLNELPQRTALLSTLLGDTSARRLYDSLGFSVLLDDMEFVPGGHLYVVMGVDLPLVATHRSGADSPGSHR